MIVDGALPLIAAAPAAAGPSGEQTLQNVAANSYADTVTVTVSY